MTEQMDATTEKKTRVSGAGVKTEDGALWLMRKQAKIDAETEAVMLKVGGGNFSLGIREAARRLRESGDTKPFSAKKHAERAK